MKGKINKEGVLEIWRKSQFRVMECRRSGMIVVEPGSSPSASACGDDCPHFREPVSHAINELGEKCISGLRLCDGTILYFNKFEDERV